MKDIVDEIIAVKQKIDAKRRIISTVEYYITNSNEHYYLLLQEDDEDLINAMDTHRSNLGWLLVKKHKEIDILKKELSRLRILEGLEENER